MKTLKEIKAINEGKFADIELYIPSTVNGGHHNFHTDYIKSYDGEEKDTLLIADWELMDEEDYAHSVYANVSDTADFGTWYDDADAKVLVCLVAEGCKQKMYAVCTDTAEISAKDTHDECDILSAVKGKTSSDPVLVKLVDDLSEAKKTLETLSVSTKVYGKTAVVDVAYIESAEYIYVDGEWEYDDCTADVEEFKCETIEEEIDDIEL